MNALLLYCRPGFEKECAAEIQDRANALEGFGYPELKAKSGYVLYRCYEPGTADRLARKLDFNRLVFARQLIVCIADLVAMPLEDRVGAVLSEIAELPLCGSLMVETADTAEAKELSKFCRKFTVPLRQALKKQKKLSDKETDNRPTLHLMFKTGDSAFIGYSYSYNHSPNSMGILRLRFPSQAPSRSTLKLEEAFLSFIPKNEWDERLAGGMRAVDLGASPGGWTYQLVRRGMMVSAVDNGPMAGSLMETGQVQHFTEDGFKFRPSRKNVYWLVCDMIEKPFRVAELMAWWLIEGYCKEAIFNLKLPMKKRYDEVKQCFELIDSLLGEHEVKYQLQAKQLYHDREEITVHLRRV